MEEKRFLFKRRFTAGHFNELIMNEHFLKLENKDAENSSLLFTKDEIKDYRYGIRWIQFELTYGREYQIFIRNKENKILKVSFKSYLGRKREILHSLYAEIVDGLWDYYFIHIINDFLEKYNIGEEFSIGDVLFNTDFIELSVSGVFRQKRIIVPWEKVRTKNYYTYFSIYSTDNAAEINSVYNYMDDWNVSVLYSVIRYILQNKGIEKYE